jgi:SOS-response transcriptional repressor LexA
MEFGDWLDNELSRRGMKQADLARATGRSSAAVNRWIKHLDIPALENIQGIARAFSMDERVVAEIAGIEYPGARPILRSAEDILAELEANQPVAVPVIRDLVAHMGSGGGFIDDFVYLPAAFRRGRRKNFLSIVAQGDCMAPGIEDGDIVTFDKDAAAKPNEIVVAAVDGHVHIKRLVEIGNRLVLRADADGSTHTLGDGDQIFGRVVYIMRPLLPVA